jgi:hypothetical protein
MKFRVWDNVTQSYSGGELWSVNASGQLYYGNAKWPEGVVEPYTGMKDVGQKEIYIGDVVKSHEKVIYPDGKYTNTCIGVVAIDQKSGCLVIHNTNGHTGRLTTKKINENKIKIVGNVHEHKDFIKLDKKPKETECKWKYINKEYVAKCGFRMFRDSMYALAESGFVYCPRCSKRISDIETIELDEFIQIE